MEDCTLEGTQSGYHAGYLIAGGEDYVRPPHTHTHSLSLFLPLPPSLSKASK